MSSGGGESLPDIIFIHLNVMRSDPNNQRNTARAIDDDIQKNIVT